jgi:hypothetical protein
MIRSSGRVPVVKANGSGSRWKRCFQAGNPSMQPESVSMSPMMCVVQPRNTASGIRCSPYPYQISPAATVTPTMASHRGASASIERRLGSGRGVGLHLTNAGREMAQAAHAREQQLTARLAELVGEERSAALTELLRESRAILREAR